MKNQKRGTNIKSTIPAIEYEEILQTTSSPETIVLLLNEKENWYASQQRGYALKKPSRYWAPCPACQSPVFKKYRQTDHITCSKACLAKALRKPKKSRGTDVPGSKIRSNISEDKLKRLIQTAGGDESRLNQEEQKSSLERSGKEPGIEWRSCVLCKQPFPIYRAWLRRKVLEGKKPPGTYCSVSCRQKVAVRKMIDHNRKHGTGGTNWTEERKRKASEEMKGERNRAWKGGVTYFRTHGNYSGVKYVRCPPEWLSMARKDGYVMEHRLIVARAIGRPLIRSEAVHHRNHDPTDNREENLTLFASNRDHKLHEHGHHIEPLWQGSSESSTPV